MYIVIFAKRRPSNKLKYVESTPPQKNLSYQTFRNVCIESHKKVKKEQSRTSSLLYSVFPRSVVSTGVAGSHVYTC